jgi:hypothetical protein
MCRGKSPDVLCGHSLGGKVVLEYLRQVASPEPSDTPDLAVPSVTMPSEAWVLDSQPGLVPKTLVVDIHRLLDAVKVRLLMSALGDMVHWLHGPASRFHDIQLRLVGSTWKATEHCGGMHYMLLADPPLSLHHIIHAG